MARIWPAWLERRLRHLQLTMQHGIREFRPRQPLDRQLDANTLNRILRELESLRISRVVNGTFKKLPGGTEIVVAPQRGGGTSTPAEAHPFQITSRQDPDNENQYLVTIEPGTINGVLPANWSNEFTISQNQLNYVALQVTANQKRIASCTVALESSWTYQEQEPSMWGVPSSFKVLLGMVRNSQVWQIAYDNLSFAVAKRLVTEKTSLQPGELPYDNWYVWQQQVGNA